MSDIEKGPSALGALAAENTVLVITKSTCPYCHQAITILNNEAMNPHEVQLDVLSAQERKEIQTELRSRYNHTTVPAIFANGEFIGGAC
jgi:glutaredoxin 3